MALTEIQAGRRLASCEAPPGDTTSGASATLRSIGSNQSLHSIRSLREIPFVDTSFDVDFNTIVGERSVGGISAAYFSTPRYSRHPESGSISPMLGSPWSAKVSPAVIGEASVFPVRDSPLRVHSPQRAHPSKESQDSVSRSHKLDADESQQKLMEDVARAAGALASMNEYVGTWAPTAHYVVVAAAALQRDSAALASALKALLVDAETSDPSSFAAQYYQLREAYSALLSLGDFSTVIYGQQGWTRAASRNTSKPESKYASTIETSWDERQLVDSFVTLLRTSPGFIASAITDMTDTELAAFCAEGDGSPLNVLFHGVLASARKNRPRILAEILKCMKSESAKYHAFAEALLRRFFSLAVGSLSSCASMKLERFIRAHLSRRRPEPSNFEAVLAACIPDELVIFVEQISCRDDLQHIGIQEILYSHICEFTTQLIMYPHQFGVIEDTFIGERQRANLRDLASSVQPEIEKLIRHLVTQTPRFKHNAPCWQANELIALKGSDIIMLYNALLPSRGNSSSSAQSPPSASREDDEWCLESIRCDLIPVMQGLAHSTATRTDGWQIFKVGEDGLVTDLGSDMGLTSPDDPGQLVDQRVIAVCDAVAHHNGRTVSDRVEAAREDARLSGDHITLLNLQCVDARLTESHVSTMDSSVANLKAKCKALRSMLDQAARDQRAERERLSKLLTILDSSRIHIWYACEVKPSTSYYKVRELLRTLYPKATTGDDEKVDGDNGMSALSIATNTLNGTKSRRLSLLSSHNVPESPFYSKDVLQPRKLADKEVDIVNAFIKRNRVRNLLPAEEVFQRAIVEIATLSRKLVHRDHLASSTTFKRDKHYQQQYAQQRSGIRRSVQRSSHHHRRSSLGLFDFFDTNSHQPTIPLTLHTTTSTQFLGLAGSHESLRYTPSSMVPNSRHEDAMHSQTAEGLGPPRFPTVAQVQALVLSDIGMCVMEIGSETDLYMQQTGQMLLEGDAQSYKPLLDDISLAGSPESKLRAVESLMDYTRSLLEQQNSVQASRSDVINRLSRVLGREPGTFYRDIQVISMLVNPSRLDRNDAFEDCCIAAGMVLDTVSRRSMDYAARFFQYYMETSGNTAPQMALMGINDSVAIWAFCAKYGNAQAQQKLSELYLQFPHLKLELSPLSRPSTIVEGLDSAGIREAVAMHWMSLASKV